MSESTVLQASTPLPSGRPSEAGASKIFKDVFEKLQATCRVTGLRRSACKLQNFSDPVEDVWNDKGLSDRSIPILVYDLKYSQVVLRAKLLIACHKSVAGSQAGVGLEDALRQCEVAFQLLKEAPRR